MVFFFSFFVPWFLYLGNFDGNKRQTPCPRPGPKNTSGSPCGSRGAGGEGGGQEWGGLREIRAPSRFCSTSRTLGVQVEGGEGGRSGEGSHPGVAPPAQGQGDVWGQGGLKTCGVGVRSRRVLGVPHLGPPARGRVLPPAQPQPQRDSGVALGGRSSGVCSPPPLLPGHSSQLQPSRVPLELWRDEKGAAVGVSQFQPVSPSSPQSRSGGNAESALRRGQVPLSFTVPALSQLLPRPVTRKTPINGRSAPRT